MRACLALFVIILSFLPGGRAAAHEGHDHNDSTRAVAAAPRGEASSADFQLVAILRTGELVIYLDRFATNEPIGDAAIEVETPAGPASATANEDGTYRLPAEWAKGADHYDLIFTVTAGDKVDVLSLTIDGLVSSAAETPTPSLSLQQLAAAVLIGLGGIGVGFLGGRLFRRRAVAALAIVVAGSIALALPPAQAHEGHDHKNETPRNALQTSRDVSQRLPDGGVFVPKPVQRLLAIRTVLAATGAHHKSAELPGRIIPDPNASGYVQSNLAGRLLPPANGFPALGARVEKGQVLAYVSPPIQAIDVSDIRQKEGEILQQMSIVERRVARYERLAETGAISKTQLDEARLELRGLKERKAALDQSRREPEELVAPVSGVIAEANTIAGQLAQPNSVIFQIVDPARLWVEALAFETFAGVSKATARVHNGSTMNLGFRGSGFAGRNQSVPLQFAIETVPEGVWAGQFVTVFVTLPESRKGILLPRAAVIRTANGQHIVYEHVSPERFEPREIRIEPIDAENVLVVAGLGDGNRVVVAGAELIDQIR